MAKIRHFVWKKIREICLAKIRELCSKKYDICISKYEICKASLSYENEFDSHANLVHVRVNKTNFHNKGFVQGRKWALNCKDSFSVRKV